MGGEIRELDSLSLRALASVGAMVLGRNDISVLLLKNKIKIDIRPEMIDLLHWFVNEDENITYRLTCDELVDYYINNKQD